MIEENGPAEASGLLKNDKIIAVNGDLIESWDEWVSIIQQNPNEQQGSSQQYGMSEVKVSLNIFDLSITFNKVKNH